ncbi:CRP/FNR family transcriptional regulator [Sphingomonas kyeonggiensis]|uniref:CRP/FNR family transcriptional regulator n=1 Tax=Sphingomonas kyeonggiensis TaxID=1268553 RepID=A0A7W7NQU3_9SPHN|nr:Crp/Fnr family transcriptional regulator [Sphingomonas kyeonggiensis]MBB4838565.1 CRP/FNR family transcriptional regulator [Sphingomonas kyeonggiensis]
MLTDALLLDRTPTVPGCAPARCQACKARGNSLCAAMGDGEISALHAIGRRRSLPAGQVFNWAGDQNNHCATVVEGMLKVTASTEDGREQIVGLLFPGDFVGELFEEDATLTVSTLCDTDLCTYPRAAFERTLEDHPRMERMLLRRTLAALGDARSRMLALGRRNAKERIAGFLLDLVERTGQPAGNGGVRIAIPISRGEMADYLGLTIETVSRQLSQLKASGILAFAKGDRGCTVLGEERLRAILNPA